MTQNHPGTAAPSPTNPHFLSLFSLVASMIVIGLCRKTSTGHTKHGVCVLTEIVMRIRQ